MNGILLVDKPKGWTSFDVVAKVRSILRTATRNQQIVNSNKKLISNSYFLVSSSPKVNLLGVSHLDAVLGSQDEQVSRAGGTVNERQTPADTAMRQEPTGAASFAGRQSKAVRKIRVGHTGTLDPMATGLLVILIGSYTKKASELTKLDKTYEVTMKLGFTSTTGDSEGTITVTKSVRPDINTVQIKKVFGEFIGEGLQTPPAYSAIKVNGQRAYKLARQGKEVKLESRKVTIYSIQLTAYSYPTVKFTAKVSSGTYVRSLVEDIGNKLGTGAYMSDLRRTQVGKFDIKDAITMDSISSEIIYSKLQTKN